MTYFFSFLYGFYGDNIQENTITINKNQYQKYEKYDNDIEKDKLVLFKNILVNNLQVVFFIIVGFLTFGFLTFAFTAYNGFILGYVIKQSLHFLSSKELLFHLLPHSTEILGIIWSCYIGYFLAIKLFKFVFGNENLNIPTLQILLQILLCIIIIIISALLEVYVSIN